MRGRFPRSARFEDLRARNRQGRLCSTRKHDRQRCRISAHLLEAPFVTTSTRGGGADQGRTATHITASQKRLNSIDITDRPALNRGGAEASERQMLGVIQAWATRARKHRSIGLHG